MLPLAPVALVLALRLPRDRVPFAAPVSEAEKFKLSDW